MTSRRGFYTAVFALATAAAIFYWRQNYQGQIGGPMSLPKILWLAYAILSWLILPAFLARSPLLTRGYRTAFRAHLANFGARAAIELWLIYVTFGWTPLYGITHDVFSIALIAVFVHRAGKPVDDLARAARHHLIAIQLTLVAEIVFAFLFYRATRGEGTIYFASTDPRFLVINRLTAMVVIAAYADIVYVIAQCVTTRRRGPAVAGPL
jgi:hypothetical protein